MPQEKTDRVDRLLTHLLYFFCLGLGPMLLAANIARTDPTLGLMLAYCFGALVWEVSSKRKE
jgi:hypothetical protein